MKPTQPILQKTIDPRAAGAVVCALAAVQGLVAIGILVNLPGDEENRLLLGLSPVRLALAGGMLLLAAAFAGLAWTFVRSPRWLQSLQQRVAVKNALLVGLLGLALGCGLALNVLYDLYLSSGAFVYFLLFERLSPLLIWLALAAAQGWIALVLAGRFHWRRLAVQRPVYRAALVGFGLMAGVTALVTMTKLGLQRDRIGWGPPTVPVLEWHLAAAALAGLLLLRWQIRRGWPRWRDGAVMGAVWLLACALWLSAPMVPSHFATAGRPPNSEVYPFSDGAYYAHFAQSLLIGDGMRGGEVPPRPLYIALLALFHTIAGQQYEAVITVQTLLLAAFPVLLYLLGKEIHSRPVGLALALLAILREWTAIYAAPFTQNVSNSQLFFADLPAALGLCAWALLVLRWLKTPVGDPAYARRAFLAGGVLGLVLLVRTQVLFTLPFVLLAALLQARWRWRSWLLAVLALGIGLSLPAAPWVLRNRAITGDWMVDHPDSQTGAMASRYSREPVTAPAARLPGESDGDYQARAQGKIRAFLWQNPGYVASFVAGHFLNAEIANLQVLPIRFGLNAPEELFRPTWAFWQEWAGSFSSGQRVAFFLYLAVILVGIGAGWARWGWPGLLPLLIHLSYHASNALARNSGGRYLLPADWVLLLYAVIGWFEIVFSALLIFGWHPTRLNALLPAPLDEHPRRTRWWVGVGLLLVLVGGLPVWLEHAFPARYPAQEPGALAAQLIAQGGLDVEAQAALEQFLQQPNAVIARGRALYPRFYAAGEGEPETAKTGYEPQPDPRTVLLVASPAYHGLVILHAAAPPNVPNAADVIVAGCRTNRYLDAMYLLVEGSPGHLALAGSSLPRSCP